MSDPGPDEQSVQDLAQRLATERGFNNVVIFCHDTNSGRWVVHQHKTPGKFGWMAVSAPGSPYERYLNAFYAVASLVERLMKSLHGLHPFVDVDGKPTGALVDQRPKPTDAAHVDRFLASIDWNHPPGKES